MKIHSANELANSSLLIQHWD